MMQEPHMKTFIINHYLTAFFRWHLKHILCGIIQALGCTLIAAQWYDKDIYMFAGTMDDTHQVYVRGGMSKGNKQRAQQMYQESFTAEPRDKDNPVC